LRLEGSHSEAEPPFDLLAWGRLNKREGVKGRERVMKGRDRFT
jgi:hypothetical protein